MFTRSSGGTHAATCWVALPSPARTRRLCVTAKQSARGFGPSSTQPSKQPTKGSKPAELQKKPQDDIVKVQLSAKRPPQESRLSESDQGPFQEVPEEVNARLLPRILIFAFIPVSIGLLLYPLFYYIKVTQHIALPMWVVYISTIFTFGGGLAGISYGILSASWDPTRPGSALGVEEFKENVPAFLDRLRGKS